MTGTEWTLDTIVRVIDGDTVRIRRSRPIELDGRHYKLTDDTAEGVACRLTWVDTPERGKPGWAEARTDLEQWLAIAILSGVTVIAYESAGWDRLLIDLIDTTGDSASQWLMRECGWPPYNGNKR